MTYVQDEALWSPDHMCQMDFLNRGRVIKPHNIKSAGELMRDLPGGGGAVGGGWWMDVNMIHMMISVLEFSP